MDRASGYGPEGWGFESLQVHKKRAAIAALFLSGFIKISFLRKMVIQHKIQLSSLIDRFHRFHS